MNSGVIVSAMFFFGCVLFLHHADGHSTCMCLLGKSNPPSSIVAMACIADALRCRCFSLSEMCILCVIVRGKILQQKYIYVYLLKL